MDFTFTLTSSPPDAFVRAYGELDVFTSQRLTTGLNEAVDVGCRRVLLDLVDVTFVDAAALRALDRFRAQLAEEGGSLRLVGTSDRFLTMCRMTGLETAFGLSDALPA
jgi:anti-sigma B factor antagonist